MPKAANRMGTMQRYIFGELDEAIAREERSGRTICDLSQSDPNWDPSPTVAHALVTAAERSGSHRYPPYGGDLALRRAFAEWYERHYDAPCTPEHVLILEGSKTGIALLPFAYLDAGDVGLVPDPGYPTYRAGVSLAGGQPVAMPLQAVLGYLPCYADLDPDDLQRAKLMFLNYPHNPTGAVAPRPFLEDTVDFARRYDLLVGYDLAYAQIVLQGLRPARALRTIAGADALAIEFFTFSKSYDMQGYRLGAAVANPDLLAPLRKVHENVTAGAFLPIQAAGRAALDPHEDMAVEERIEGYRHRQDILYDALQELGAHVTHPQATVYLWLRSPRDLSGGRFAQELLRGPGIAVTPGSAFGQQGNAYVRISLTAPDDVVAEAAERLRRFYPQGLEARPHEALQAH